MYNTPLRYGSYVYPQWGKALGACMGATCCLQILIWAVVAISRETGTLKDVSIFPASWSCTVCSAGDGLCPICFFAAFPEINSTPELLEGEPEQHREKGGARGARESGGSVLRHAYRHGLYRDGVGDELIMMSKLCKEELILGRAPARLWWLFLIKLCSAGQCKTIPLFILCKSSFFFFSTVHMSEKSFQMFRLISHFKCAIYILKNYIIY